MSNRSSRRLVRWITLASALCIAMAGTARAVSIVAPSSLAMSATSGAGSDVETIDITSSGAQFSFTLLPTVITPSGINWLNVDRRSGTTPATITLTANPLGLGITNNSVPPYQATIEISAQGATNSPFIVTITFQVFGSRQLAVDAPQLNFAAAAGSASVSQSLGITSEGAQGGELLYNAALATQSGGAWLSVNPTTALTPRVMSVTVSAANLSPGRYIGTIFLADTSNSPSGIVIVNVVLDVSASTPPAISLAPTSLQFSAAQGSSPPSQSFQITNSGSGPLNWSAVAATQSGGNWLSISSASGSAPSTVTVTVNSAQLSSGSYSGSITVSSSGVSNSPQILNVSLTVGSQPTISPNLSSLFFSTLPGINPPSQNLQITNSGPGVLGWSAAASTTTGGNWLSVSPPSGTAPSTLTATVSSSQLAQGNYDGKLTITSSGASNSPKVVNTRLTVSTSAPAVPNNSVVNGASFSTDAVVAPNTVASLFGSRLASGLFTASTLPLPDILGTTQLFVNGVAAPLFFASASQINFQMPPGLTGNTALVNVVFNGATSSPIAVNIAPAVPGIFTRSQDGNGQGAVLNGDSSPNSSANPAARGSTVQIFATGLGPTNPPVNAGDTGATSEPFNRTTTLPDVKIGGISAHVDFSAVAPGFVALYQVNAVVPPNSPTGSAVPVTLTIGGRTSNTVTIAVQ